MKTARRIHGLAQQPPKIKEAQSHFRLLGVALAKFLAQSLQQCFDGLIP
jgi:hypothetical protein